MLSEAVFWGSRLKTRIEINKGGYSDCLRITILIREQWTTFACIWFGGSYPIQSEREARTLALELLSALRSLPTARKS
jgi:hypothetical protein